MRVIVCGSRNWSDEYAIGAVLTGIATEVSLHPRPVHMTVVHGAAQGADIQAAALVARRMPWVVLEPHPAAWSVQGRAAGHIRNQEMADAGADLCVAFAFGDERSPISSGTKSMIDKARKAGIRVWVVRSDA